MNELLSSDDANRTIGAGQPVDPESEAYCANCGEPIGGTYCGSCGQAAHLHRSIAGLMHELLHGVFHFEGKL